MRLRVPSRGAEMGEQRDPYRQSVYDGVAQKTAARVISAYSSSFGMASRLLQQPTRGHIRNIYALVRLADEIADGEKGVRCPDRARALLERLRADTDDALTDGYSSNLIVHAFASTARECGIGSALTAPFFASMQTDLSVREHDADSFAAYVYGSAEVVGLMCLQVFLTPAADESSSAAVTPADLRYEQLATGARRLGAAFQKVNFLRDLRDDYVLRGRSYFPGIDPERLTEADKRRLLDDIDADLEVASSAVAQLPDNSRLAVAVAHGVFSELSARLRACPADRIFQQRVRVPAPTKARIALAACLRQASR